MNSICKILLVHLLLGPVSTSLLPSNYEQQLGSLTITTLCDGYVDMNLQNLITMQNQTVGNVHTSKTVFLPINIYLINTGSQRILIDTGLASLYNTKTGELLSRLQQAGYKPDQIDAILITHLHPDHMGGLTTEAGTIAFKNAKIYIARTEATFWQDEKQEALANEDNQPVFPLARKILKPYADAGQLRLFDNNETLFDGVKIIPAAGHTPGHTGYLFESQGQKILFCGDIIHCHELQFSQPDIGSVFDINLQQSIDSRRRLFSYAASENILVGSAHMPFPGLGHVEIDSSCNGFRWLPRV